jgi:hypothetical protein
MTISIREGLPESGLEVEIQADEAAYGVEVVEGAGEMQQLGMLFVYRSTAAEAGAVERQI